MRGLGKIDLMQPNVIWGRGRSLGLKQCHWNAGRQVPPIGKKNQWDITASSFCAARNISIPMPAGSPQVTARGKRVWLFCHQQSTCTKNEISKRQVPNFWV
jgi:hypothetical protein